MVIAQNTKQLLSIPSAHTDPRNNFRQTVSKELGWAGLQEMDNTHSSTGKMLQHPGDLLTLGFHLHWVCGFRFSSTEQLQQLPPTPARYVRAPLCWSCLPKQHKGISLPCSHSSSAPRFPFQTYPKLGIWVKTLGSAVRSCLFSWLRYWPAKLAEKVLLNFYSSGKKCLFQRNI